MVFLFFVEQMGQFLKVMKVLWQLSIMKDLYGERWDNKLEGGGSKIQKEMEIRKLESRQEKKMRKIRGWG